MKLVELNPYRILGLLVGATAREQERQVKRLKQFIEAEHEAQVDFDFPALGHLQRTIENVTEAASKLNLDSDKLNAALFWFYKGNSITDEPAFDAIKDSDLDQVISIWTKLTSSGEVTQRNASAYSNLGTLYLSGILEGTNTNEYLLEQGVFFKIKFLESDFVNELKLIATDTTFKISKKDLQITFLKTLNYEIEKNKTIQPQKFIEVLKKQNFTAKSDFLSLFISKPIEQIEKVIEIGRNNRKADKTNSIVVGKKIIFETLDNHSLLKSILGSTDIKFVSISDKIADEVLQCGIDYYNHFIDTDFDPGPAALDLCKKAKSYTFGNITKTRCEETIEIIQKWVDKKPERDKEKRISNDLEKLKNLIDEYDTKSETVAIAKEYLNLTRPHLNNIRAVLGFADDLYLKLSTRIASDAQSMCVSQVNKLQDRFKNAYDSATKITVVRMLKDCVNEAYEVTNTIATMDLRSDFRTKLLENRTTLSGLKNQLNPSSGGSGTGSCYIATMAYGDYDHPQVMILRQFRDEVLNKYSFGKWFIKKYYYYSPKLVEKLKNKKGINIFIRKSLNQLIKLIK